MAEHTLEMLLEQYNRLYKMHDDAYRSAARKFNLPQSELWILYFLRCEEIHSQKDLCDCMVQPKQSINSALKKMEQEGLIRMEADEENRKVKNIFLTKEGMQLAKDTADQIIEAENQAFYELTDEERIRLLACYERYVTLLQKQIERIQV